ncbi:helix-turn-helix domain-containing protein [Paraburkholderia aromaticivorans]|uniref:helix-turn-helix domain-containing protein n=1 Tax=Paraburkholderia aromaticivorans TaxID=2026199 RepID=UPI001FCA3141|nr:helix-turn-helix domain-containing protein [Paraburkholderia aromaticivorans]
MLARGLAAAAFSRQTSGQGLTGNTAASPGRASGGVRTRDALLRRTGSVHGTYARRPVRAARSDDTSRPIAETEPISIKEFNELNNNYDTVDGYPRNSEANGEIAQKIEDGIGQEMTGYPPEVIQFQQRETHLQGMLADLPESERQFYAAAAAMLGTAYPLETGSDSRYEIGQKMTALEDAVRDEANRVRNDPVDRALSIFNPPMGVAWLNKEDRDNVDYLDKLRDDFLDATNADERDEIFEEASELKDGLQRSISAEVDRRRLTADGQWKEANGEVDRILSEARAQTDPAKRYELIGRQLYEGDPGQDTLKDKVVLAFTQRMQDSAELRDTLDTWHAQVSGPLNAHSVGAAKRYTDILRNLPPASGDYVRDLSDQYNAVLKDTSYKDYSITPAARSEKLAGQVLEGIARVLLGVTPLAPLADLLPSTLPAGIRMGLDYGSALLGMIAGEAPAILNDVGLAGKALATAAKDAEAANLASKDGAATGENLAQSAGRIADRTKAGPSAGRDAQAAGQAIDDKPAVDAGPSIDPTSQLAHQRAGDYPYGSLEAYADPNVHPADLHSGARPGILEDARGDRYVAMHGKAYHVRFDNQSDTWRVFMKGADLKPQYPVRLNEITHRWEINTEVGLTGGAPKISEQTRKEIIRLLKEGNLSRAKIAATLGISTNPVARIMNEEKIVLTAPDSLRTLKITPADEREIVRLLEDGVLTRVEIAKKMGISPSMVGKISKRNNLGLHGKYLPPAIRRKAENLLREGKLTNAQIAAETKISSRTVTRIKKDMHLAKFVRRRRITPEIRQDVIQRINDGLTYDEIAAATGVSKMTVRRIAQQTNTFRGVVRTSPEQIDRVFTLKDEGKTPQEVADAVGISVRKVRDIYANVNADSYKRIWWDTTPEKRTAAIRQLDEGKNANQVAKDLGLQIETVRGIANQHRVARDSLASELLAEGRSPEDVAASLNISPKYVAKLTKGVPESTHEIRFTAKDRDAAMEMFEKGYSREDVATKLGISPWKAHSLANEFRTNTMNSVTPQQLDDIARALGLPDYDFTTGDLARATQLPETTVRVVEQEYARGLLVSRPSSPVAGTSSAMPAAEHYEWLPPLSAAQEIEAIRAMDEGLSLTDIAAQLKEPGAVIQQLYEDDLPLMMSRDDPPDAPPAQPPAPQTRVLSKEDEAEVQEIVQRTGLRRSFVTSLFFT